MVPTYEDFLTCACQWRGEHRGITYQLHWHGRSDYSPQGTWCYYIFVSDEQFYPEDWAKLRLEKQDKQFSIGGSWHRHWSYDSFPDLKAHCGWTFGEMSVYLGREGKEQELVKVGCDYAHLWDREGGFLDRKQDVERDAKRSIDLLVEQFPKRRERCAYSGKYDDAEQFYTARNGLRVHNSQQGAFTEDGWSGWLPAEAA